MVTLYATSSGCFTFSLQDLRRPPKPLHDPGPTGNLLAVMWHATARAPALVLSRAGDGGGASGSVTLAIVKRDPNSRTLSPQRDERKLCFLWLAGGVSGPWALHGWANAIRHTAGTSVCRNLVSLYMTNAPHTEAPGCDCGGQQLYISSTGPQGWATEWHLSSAPRRASLFGLIHGVPALFSQIHLATTTENLSKGQVHRKWLD
ncbi:unnamed protein product [Boreogadus saida]